MVFEAVVVDVLNRFLGAYVENLNKDQLKLGIWGGDVVLQNLTVKQTALEELNFPVKTVFGHLGKLVLKIPWKNLYGASVEASIDNLLLIVHPIAEVKYNAEKEEKQALADKQAELRRIEDARKKEADKDKPKIDETFVEKLATQIIKNVQLKIKRIHVRYEDTITNPKAPFSCGFTLHNLSVHTTDSNWTKSVASEAVTKIFKILNLEGLSIYWNPNANIYSKKDPAEVLETLSDRIATKTTKGKHYNYLLGPINATAKLQLNPKPESDDPPFKVAKVVLTLHMEELAVSMNREQYQDIMRLVDSFDMMTKAAPYRKYRPDLKVYRGHYKVWWHFAYKCILIEEVRRRRKNWDWKHMKAYRDLCRAYGNAYMQYKLSNKGKVAPEVQQILEKGEKELAILSLVIMRQQMEIEVEKKRQEEKAANEQKTWFSRWWSGGGVEPSDSDLNLIKRFEAEITPEEKSKLYRAIDYQETSAPQDLPQTYVSIDARFSLDTLLLVVTNKVTVLRGEVNDVQIDFAQRPSANAMRVDVSMRTFSVFGVEQGGFEPQLVASKHISENVKLINIAFETNPIDAKCDNRVIVSARPLEIIYDAQTIIEIVNVFKPPQDTMALSSLQEAAALKLLDLKEKSATGMQYMIDQHALIELDINMDSSYVVVPHTGLYKGKEACCVIQLGTLSVKSEPRSAANVNTMFLQGFDEEQIFNEVSKQCYDKLAISLEDMQVVLSYADEDWHSSLSGKSATDLHLLEPTNLVIRVHKCVIEDDPRMPKLKIFGDLENVYISAAEDRLYKLFEILIDMPLPKPDNPEPLMKKSLSKTSLAVPLMPPIVPIVKQLPSIAKYPTASPSRSSSMSLLKYLDSSSGVKNTHSDSLSETTLTQLTNMEALFVMKELKITMKRKVDKVYDKYLVFILNLLESKATQKTYTLTSELKLGAISFNQYRQDYNVVNVIDTPLWRSGSGDQYLFNIRYSKVDRKCPEFRSFYQSVEQLIELEFSNVNLLMHLECLQQILVIANDYQTRLNDMQMQRDRIGDAGPLETIMEDEELVGTKSKASAAVEKKSKHHKVETIHLKIMVNIKNIGIGFATNRAALSDVQLRNMAAGLIVKDSYTQVDCLIGDIKIIDLFPTTIHKEILSVVKGEVANIRVVLYNTQFMKTPDNVDMSVNVEFSCLRLVFINRYVTGMLGFLNNFQEAQNRIIQASSQAADAARANVQSAYENSTKIDMNLKLDAPIIVVPENSMSLRALLFDFGQMTIANKFVDLPTLDQTAKVTTDELTLDLGDMKLTYINMDENLETTLEKTILQPISCSLLVKRNLSMWYDKIPDLEVSGRLKSIVLTLTRDDYQSIMNILTQNLKEGVQEAPPKPKPIVSEKGTHESVTNKPRATLTKSTVSLTSLAKAQETVKTSVKFQFTMDSFVIDLFHMVHDKMVSLAQFRLVLLCMRGRMLSNGSIHTSILLIDMTLDDMRPGREDKITRYLERRRSGRGDGEETIATNSDTAPKETRSMVDITFTAKNNDTFIDMRVFSFNLILAMDFMNKLLAFLAVEEEDKEKFLVHEVRDEAAKKRSSTGTSLRTSASSHDKHTSNPEEDHSMMTVNIRIEKPDIILVESLDSKDCMALVLNMECEMKYRHRDQSTVADGGISELQLYIRKFNDPLPSGTDISGELRYVLSPTSISVAMSQPYDSGMHVDMALSDINITISPDVLELVNKVITTITSSGEEKQETEDVPIKYDNVWGPEPFEPSSFWFLKTELGEEAAEVSYEGTGLVQPVAKTLGEICLLSSPSIVFSLELEIGSERLPMLVMQASLNATVKDWSSSLLLESTWAMQVSYYNIQRAMWEPFIEPVEVLDNSTYKHAPWELNIHVGIRGEDKPPSVIDLSDEEAAAKAMAEKKARMSVLFSSEAQLDLTISRSGLEALTELGAAFSAATATDTDSNLSAASIQEIKKNKYEGAPFVFHNYTGFNTKLVFDERSDFCVHSARKSVNDYKEVVLETNSHVPLQLRRPGANIVKLNEPSPPRRLDVKIDGLGEIQIPVERADKRFFPLDKKSNSESWGLISEVAMLDASLNVSLRSIVQVTNNLSVNVSVYYMKPSGNEVSLLGEVKPGQELRLPLQAVYTPSAELFFSVEGFTVSVSPFSWRLLQQELQVTKLLHCNSKEKGSIEKFYLWVAGDMEQAYFESSNRHTFASSCYNIKLEPAVILQNCLPVDVVVSESGLRRSKAFSAGELAHMSHLAPNKATIVILIPNYLEKSWECTAQIPESETEFSVWSFTSHDSPSVMTLDLGMHNKNSNGTQHLSIYCPFWMLNKTGLTLSYRNLDDADVIFHPADYKEPVLFSFRAKNFFGKKKASIRVEFGEWSDKFSLDVAGSSGVIYCKNEGRTYQVAVTNTLSFNSLTKMVVFMPFVILTNYAPFDIEYQEAQRPGDPWGTVEKKSCTSVWPITEKAQKLLIFRVRGSPDVSAPMVITEEHATCLKLTNEYGGLFLEVQMCEGGTNITVRQYVEGQAPALLINFSPHAIKVYEKENVNVRKLLSMHKMMFTWDAPAGPRVLIMRGLSDAVCNKKEVEIDLKQDGIGTMQVEEHTFLSWVSFLNGIQRVILVTDDIMLARGIYVAGENEAMDMEVILSMKGMGLSLVNDFENQEIVYLSACHSGIIWEQCKIGAQRYKKLDPLKITEFELAYQRYLMEKQINPDTTSPLVNIDERTLVNWSEMRILKPNGRLLRRTLEPGLWARYSTSAHFTQIHARLHRLQVDQQLPSATFPVTLAPTPPPLSLQNQGIKPFIEVSIVEHIMTNSNVRQYKYFKILVQEFHIKIDMGLVNALMNMFPQKELTQQEALDAFNKDVESAKSKIDDISIQGTATEQSNFYDNLHLSPLKVHVSFSLGNSTTIPTFVGTLLQGIGVTLTDMNDVVFKLSYYERKYQFLTQTELKEQIQQHYTGQALKQLYVLVLGLDVLGNPYGLVVGLKKGVEDLFYEPFQGAIQGPGEFAEGLYIGVRSLVGHTVGGAAGAFSRITGAMGHGIAALSMDKDYQKQRRDGMNKPPQSLQEGLARSGRGLVMGFVDGVTGVITKPIEGAQEQGMEGFFKGLGRGAVGLVARPTAGLVDFAAGSLGAVKRAADLSEEITRRRPPRYLPKNQGVTPYSRQQAEGFIILSEIEKGKYLATDTYEAHVWVIVSKEAVLCTDKRIVYVEKNSVFGGLQVAWTFLWTELTEAPSITAKGVFIPTGKKKVFGVFNSSNVGKVILIHNEEHKQYLLSHCVRLHRMSVR